MKEIKITVPDNCELKQDGNTYTIIEKENNLTYESVSKDLFCKGYWYINSIGHISKANTVITNSNNCTSEKQARKLLAINMLMNVAKYLNGDWQAN